MVLSRGSALEGGKLLKAETIPRDLITSNEAIEQLGISYARLHDWWQRGVIRSWRMGRRRLVSRAEVRRVLRARDGVKPTPRKAFMGEISGETWGRPEPLREPSRRPALPPALPDLPERPSLPQQGPWGYTVE